MNLLRSLLHRRPPADDGLDLTEHDQNITNLVRVRNALKQANSEPLTARVRGEYPDRRVRTIRINPRSAEHHG